MPRQTPPTAVDEVAGYAAQSSISLKTLKAGGVALRATFVFRSLRYELEGVIEGARLGPIRHRLSKGKAPVYEATVLSGSTRGRTEITFGKGVDGLRSLVIEAEPLAQGSLITGYADGKELLPLRSGSCGCATDTAKVPQRPVLAWDGPGSVAAVKWGLPRSVREDCGGLAEVVQTTLTRQLGTGTVGDFMDIVDWLFCHIRCIGEVLKCFFTQPGIPGTKNIFDTLCMVQWGACTMVCKVNRPF